MDALHCAAHTWASPAPKVTRRTACGLERIEREHAYWIERFTPEQIVQLAGFMEEA